MNVVPMFTIDSNELYIYDDPQNKTISDAELGGDTDEQYELFDSAHAKCAKLFNSSDPANKWKRLLVSRGNINYTIARYIPYPHFAY